MKKTIAIIILAVIVMTSASVSVYAESQLLGDIDSNGKVELYDARLALRYAIGLNKPTNQKKNIADWNRDGNVTSSDARKILRTAMGLEKTKTLKETTTEKKEETTTKKSTKKVVDHYESSSFRRIEYDNIPVGGEYYICYSDGTREEARKPDDTPYPPIDLHHCEYCGKNVDDVKGHWACAYGGCGRWVRDIDCPECGVFIPAYTCHTCKNGAKYYKGSKQVSWKDIKVGDKYTIVCKDGTKIKEVRPDMVHCKYCGKECDMTWNCAYGGCSRWDHNVRCVKCGEYVKANTCHTCKSK